MNRLPKDTMIVLGVLAVTAAGAFLLVYRPQGQEMEGLNARIALMRNSLEEDTAKAVVVPQMVRQVQEMKRRYKDFDRRLPKQKELGGFLREISANLAEESLSNVSIEPGNPTREELFHALPIIMKFSGSYPTLGSFLQRIDGMERLTRVQKLKIQTDPKDQGLRVEMQMNIYFTES